MPVTFHRAFDMVRLPERELETLCRLGVARVLTSGQSTSAYEGRERLASLVRLAAGRIEVIAAGSVRPENVGAILAASGVPAVHLAASTRRESAMTHRNALPRLAGGRTSEAYAHWETEEQAVRALLEALRGGPE